MTEQIVSRNDIQTHQTRQMMPRILSMAVFVLVLAGFLLVVTPIPALCKPVPEARIVNGR